MTEKFTIKGEWYLPTKRVQKIYGILTFEPQEGIDLEIYGNFNGDYLLPELIDEEIILGLTNDSEQITLYSCFMTGYGGATLVQGEESGKPSLKYSIKYILIGLHAKTKDDLMFNQISSEIFNLGEWVGISGFKREFYYPKKPQKKEIVVEYQLPEPIDFEINNSTKGRFNFIANHPGWSRYQKTVSITQRVVFQAITIEDKSINELLELVLTFQNFLTLALYKSTYPLSISLSGEKHKKDLGVGDLYKKKIKMFFSSNNFKLNEKPKLNIEMIFDFRRIKNDFQSIIRKWYSKYEKLEPAFDLVFEQFYNGNKFSVNTFLNLAQSAETFHARVHNHTRIPKEQFKKMKEEILKVAPSEYHPWLNDQFNFGNNLNLHTRLTELTEKYSNNVLDKILGNKTQFILNVKYSRNYYTHYSNDGKKKALKGEELFYLSERLKILLVCSFLIEVGFDRNNLSSYLDNIKWKLFNHLADWSEDEKEKASH